MNIDHYLSHSYNHFILSPKELMDDLNINQKIYEEYKAQIEMSMKAKGTAYKNYSCIRRFIEWIDHPVTTIREVDIYNYLYDYEEKDISLGSISSIQRSIRVFCRWLYESHYLERNLFNKFFDIPYQRNKDLDVLTSDEVKQIINVCNDLRERCIIELLYSTGMRIHELLTVKIRDINLQERIIKVYGKGDKERFVLISKRCLVVLKEYLKHHGEQTDFLITWKNNYSRPLTSTCNINQMIRGIIAKTTITKNVTCHTFRRSFATNLLHLGMPIENIQYLLGHSFLKTTIVYTKSYFEDVKRSYDQIFSSDIIDEIDEIKQLATKESNQQNTFLLGLEEFNIHEDTLKECRMVALEAYYKEFGLMISL